MNTSSGRSTDAVIVGGGPAGLAAAIALRQEGIDCLVVDALRPPIEKGCGEGLMPGTRRSLERLGVSIAEEEGYGFQGIRLIHQRDRVDARFPDGVGIGVRRTHLHARMHERAAAMGVKFAWETHARLEENGRVSIGGEAVRARWVIGADGTASRVRRWAGLDAVRFESERFGFRRHYRVAPWSEYVEIYWGTTGQVYVTPVAADQVCLVYISRNKQGDKLGFLNEFPELLERLHRAAMVTPQRGALSATRRLKTVARGAVALVGDASGSVDAITGEGLAMAFHQASELAASLAGGGLEAYAGAHGKLGERPHSMGRLMLTMDRWTFARRYGIRALAANRTLFKKLLSVHVGAESLASFTVRHGPAMGWGVVAGLRQR